MKMNSNVAISEEEKIRSSDYISLRDICPIWSNRLDKLSKHSSLHLPTPLSTTWFRLWSKVTSNSECIVGEAHGFSPLYNCDECERFADNFSLYFYFHSSARFDQTTQEFTQHWSERHMHDRVKSNSS
jgi:hypothetical protein